MDNPKFDLNTASLDDLKSINGIGQVRAETIINARKKLGGFKSVEDLGHIPRLGRSFVEKYQCYFSCKHMTAPAKHRTNSSTPSTRFLRSSAVSRSSLKRKHPSDEIATRSSSRNKQEPVKATISRLQSRTQSNSRISTNRRSRNRVHLTNRESVGQSSDETEKTPNDIKLDLFLVFGEGSRSSKRHVVGQSGDTSNSSSSNLISSSHSAQSEGTKQSLEVDSTDVISTNQNEEVSISNLLPGSSIRSKLPVSMENVERHWKKQKLESSSIRGDFELEHDTTVDGGLVSGSDEACGEPSESLSSLVVCKKPRIPSKKNPQPELHGWLSTFQGWGHAEKLLALDELMSLCDPTQVRHVMQVIEPQFQRDFISLLPKELALYVLSFLDPKDLLRAAQTCTYWHSLAEDNLLWREKCQEECVTEALVYPSGRRGKSAHAGRGDKNAWKALYLRQKQIEYNWRTSIRTPKVLKGHDDHVITCLEFSGNKIVSGSDDNTLKVWSSVTGRCLRTLTGHTGGVWSSQMSGSVIISGSTDRTLKVWNADTGQCKHTLYGHTSTVRCMHLHNKRVVSGSRDATLRVWDIDSGQCLHILIGHVAAVRCVQYDGHRVISGGYDYMVKIWDPETETCLQTLAGHTNRVYSLQFDGTHIVSGSLDTSIRVWNAETGVCVHTLIGHQSLTSGMELKDNILVSGNADSTVKVWNIMTGQCLQTLQGPNKHQSAVTCLQFNGTLIITSSDDGTVKLWDLKTGDFLRNLVALESGGSGGVVWRIRCNNTKLVCAVGSRNGTEETKLLVIDFDVQDVLDSNQQSSTAVAIVRE